MFNVESCDNLEDLLLGVLQIRLSSFGHKKILDIFGNVIYVDVDIYSKNVLKSFLLLSLSEFNSVPKFTNFDFRDSRFVNTFLDIIIEGAVIHALASRSLIERGREFSIEEDGINFVPPSVSEIMQTQFFTLYNAHFEKLKLIKSEIHLF